METFAIGTKVQVEINIVNFLGLPVRETVEGVICQHDTNFNHPVFCVSFTIKEGKFKFSPTFHKTTGWIYGSKAYKKQIRVIFQK